MIKKKRKKKKKKKSVKKNEEENKEKSKEESIKEKPEIMEAIIPDKNTAFKLFKYESQFNKETKKK